MKIIKADNVVSLFPLLGWLFIYRKIKTMWLREMILSWLDYLVDSCVAWILRPCDVFIGASTVVVKSSVVAKNKYNATVICDCGIDEKMEEAKEDAKDVADEKEKRQERLDALEEKRAVEKALIEGTKEAVDRAKEKQQKHEAPDMKLDEMLTLTTEHKQMNGVEQGLDDIKSSMKVLEADLKGIKVDKEV